MAWPRLVGELERLYLRLAREARARRRTLPRPGTRLRHEELRDPERVLTRSESPLRSQLVRRKLPSPEGRAGFVNPRRLGLNSLPRILIVTAAGLAAAMMSCGKSGQTLSYEERLANTGEPALHSLQSERLRGLMGELDRLAKKEDYGHALKLEEEQDETVEVAAALERSVAALRAAADALQLTDAERQTFVGMVAKLERHVQEFSLACQSRDLPAMKTAMNLMTVTCNACHSTFRKMKP